MTLIGDLERAFAALLYPTRVPVAMALTLAVVLFIVAGRRRGWFATARRNPARSGGLLALVLALALPAGWYLGSPLFVRTALVEPAPSSGTPLGSPAARSGTVAPVLATPRATEPPSTPGAPRSGRFRGADDFHFGRGVATLLQTGPSAWVVRFEDFSVRNGPDLYVYLSPDPAGYADDAIELGRLRATDGSFNTPIPLGTDVSRARSIVIWCKQFSVQFAVARLS